MKITIIGKPGCHLCDMAKEDVAKLIEGRGIELELLSILDDPSLNAKYCEEIPVIMIDGKVHDVYRVNETRFMAAIGNGSSR